MPLPNPFPAARYRLEFQVDRPLALPPFAGSTLRGVFGHALRRTACVTGLPACEPCALYRSCAYPAVFESPPPPGARRIYSDIPQPYVVEPPPMCESGAPLRPGSAFAFDLVLIGPALSQLPLVLLAWQRALHSGIGAGNRGRAQLQRVWLQGDDEPVLAGPQGRLRPHATGIRWPEPAQAPSAVRLNLLTPLRIKREGRVVAAGQPLTAVDVLMAIVRRVAELCELQLATDTGFDFSALREAACHVHCEADLHWQDGRRWSNRQQQHVPLDGLVGRIVLRGPLAPFWPLLHLGQWLHLGGKASHGLGRYALEPLALDAAPVHDPAASTRPAHA